MVSSGEHIQHTGTIMYKSIICELELPGRTDETAHETRGSIRQQIGRLVKNHAIVYGNERNGKIGMVPIRSVLAILPDRSAGGPFSLAEDVVLPMRLYFEVMFMCHQHADACSRREGERGSVDAILEQLDKADCSELLDRFKSSVGPSVGAIASEFFELLSQKHDEVKTIFPAQECFRVFVLSLYVNDCFPGSFHHEEVASFVKLWQGHHELLVNGTQTEQEQWWKLAGSYFGLNQEIGTSYFHLDSIRVRNSLVEARWLKVFSHYEIAIQDLLYQKKLLELQVFIKHQEPLLTVEQCSSLAHAELIKEQENLQTLRSNSLWANALNPSDFSQRPEQYEQLVHEFRQKADYLFRLAAKLLHPDRRIYIVGQRRLSPEQDKQLTDLYHELLSIHESKSLSAFDLMTTDFLSPHKIKNIISKAEMIFLEIGIKLPLLQFTIMGETLAEQLAFLHKEQQLLHVELAQIQAAIQMLYSDREIYQKEAVLGNPESIQLVTTRFQNVMKTYEGHIGNLQTELSGLFGEA
jgi:hypothetical protein